MIFIYQMIGGCPTPIGTNTNHFTAFWYGLITVVHLLLATVQLVLVLGFHVSFFNPRDMFGQVNDTIKYCGVGFAYYTIVIESFVRRCRHVQFWQTAASFRQQQNVDPMTDTAPTLASTTTNQNKPSAAGLSVDRTFLMQFGAFWTMAVLLEVSLMPIIMEMEPSLRFWMMHRYTLTFRQLRHWQFVHYVRVVDVELRMIADRVKCIARYAAYGGNKNFTETGDYDCVYRSIERQ